MENQDSRQEGGEALPPQNTADLTAFVQTLLQQMQSRFQSMSDTIISKIDEVGSRIDDLEKNVNELMKDAESSSDKPPPLVPSK